MIVSACVRGSHVHVINARNMSNIHHMGDRLSTRMEEGQKTTTCKQKYENGSLWSWSKGPFQHHIHRILTHIYTHQTHTYLSGVRVKVTISFEVEQTFSCAITSKGTYALHKAAADITRAEVYWEVTAALVACLLGRLSSAAVCLVDNRVCYSQRPFLAASSSQIPSAIVTGTKNRPKPSQTSKRVLFIIVTTVFNLSFPKLLLPEGSNKSRVEYKLKYLQCHT